MKRALRIAGITFGLACAGVAVVAASVLRDLPLTEIQRERAGRRWTEVQAWLEEHDCAETQP